MTRTVLLALALALGLSACGIKGPLDAPPPKDVKKQERAPGQ